MENKEALFESIFNRELEDEETTGYLENITNAYPFFTPAQFYLLLQTPKNSSDFQKQIQKTATLFNNNYWLNYLLTISAKDEQLFEAAAFKNEEIIADAGPAFETNHPLTTPYKEHSGEQAQETAIPPESPSQDEKQSAGNEQTKDHPAGIEPEIAESGFPVASAVSVETVTVNEGTHEEAVADFISTHEPDSPQQQDYPHETQLQLEENEHLTDSEKEAGIPLSASDTAVAETDHPSTPSRQDTSEQPADDKESIYPLAAAYANNTDENHPTTEDAIQLSPPLNAVTIAESVAEEKESLQETNTPDADQQAAAVQDAVLAEVLAEISIEQPIEPPPVNNEQEADATTTDESFAQHKEIPKETTYVDSSEQAAGLQDAVLAEVMTEINAELPAGHPPLHSEQETATTLENEPTGWQQPDVAGETEQGTAEIHTHELPLSIPPIQQVPVNEQVLFEPLHTSDYFASVGIKLSEEQRNSDRLGKQLKSFTQWLKTMKRIETRHAEPLQPMESGSEPADHTIQQMAEFSNQGDEIITEAMAEVLLQQGRKSKAIAVLEKLSLLNPSKSTYFAAKIDQLKE